MLNRLHLTGKPVVKWNNIYFSWLCFATLFLLGVAFSKHIVQIYTYNPTGDLRHHLEVSPKFLNPRSLFGCYDGVTAI